MSIGWVWAFMFTAGAVFFTSFQGFNPLDWRTFNPASPNMQVLHQIFAAGYSNHHTLNLALEGGLCVWLAWSLSKDLGGSILKQGWLSTYGAVQVWAIHEGLWWLTYLIVWKPDLIVFSGFGEIVTCGLLIFTAVLGLYQPRAYFLSMVAFYLVWAAVGFPITESFKGNTGWYGTLWGDAWEVGSWAYAVVVYKVLAYRGLVNWAKGVRFLVRAGP